jgi:ferredoxin
VPTISYLTSGQDVEFPDGDEVNLLRVSLRNDCGVPYRCASGNCGTDRVKVEAGADNLSPVRRKERERLGEELLAAGYRLCCQTYALGDVAISWDPNQKALDGRGGEKLRERWLEGKDTD